MFRSSYEGFQKARDLKEEERIALLENWKSVVRNEYNVLLDYPVLYVDPLNFKSHLFG